MGARANRQAGSCQQGGMMNAVYLDRIQGLTLEECGQAIVELEAKLAEAEQRAEQAERERDQFDEIAKNRLANIKELIAEKDAATKEAYENGHREGMRETQWDFVSEVNQLRTALEAAESWRDKYREDNWEVAIYVKDALEAARGMAERAKVV